MTNFISCSNIQAIRRHPGAFSFRNNSS